MPHPYTQTDEERNLERDCCSKVIMRAHTWYRDFAPSGATCAPPNWRPASWSGKAAQGGAGLRAIQAQGPTGFPVALWKPSDPLYKMFKMMNGLLKEILRYAQNDSTRGAARHRRRFTRRRQRTARMKPFKNPPTGDPRSKKISMSQTIKVQACRRLSAGRKHNQEQEH